MGGFFIFGRGFGRGDQLFLAAIFFFIIRFIGLRESLTPLWARFMPSVEQFSERFPWERLY
jgi:hypothetical protein